MTRDAASLRVDIWNTVGSKTELDLKSKSGITREEFVSTQIAERYAVLQAIYGIEVQTRRVVRDDSTEYQNIVLGKLEKHIKEGRVEVSTLKYHHCEDCDYTFALAPSCVTECAGCGSTKLDIVEADGLTMSMSESEKRMVLEKLTVLPSAGSTELRRRVLTMPPILQLSKQREYGIDLTSLGVDERFVLDPKAGLGMMSLVVKELGYGEIKAVVQGIDSVGYLAPYQTMLDPESRPIYITHGTVPPFTTENVERSKDFYFRYLPTRMLSLPRGIDVETRLALYKEYSRAFRGGRALITREETAKLIEKYSPAIYKKIIAG